MRECANTGCTDVVDVLVPCIEPVELMAYCKQCGIYEYRHNEKAQGVFDDDADLTALLGDLPESVDISEIDGFETMADRMDVESGPVKRYNEADPSDDDATRTVSGMVRTGPDADDVERVEYVLDEDDDVIDAIRYAGAASKHSTAYLDDVLYGEDDDT